MTLLSFLVFLPTVLAGILLLHLIWPERTARAVLFKLSLGAGLGLGMNSFVYFVGLLSPLDPRGILISQIVLLVVLLVAVLLRERTGDWSAFHLPGFSHFQWALLAALFTGILLSGLIFLNLSEARPQGAHDAWSIWNRAARFIYRDFENWTATASPDLYWATHPDYPLLIPLNVAWGWDKVSTETHRIPQVQSALFSFASIALLFAAVGMVRTAGQASLAALVLMSTPILIESGYSQISDIPLSFFVLGTCALMFFYFKYDRPVFLVLAGLTAGLAAWTKNEGLLFVLVSFAGLLLGSPKRILQSLIPYLAGLAVPLSMVLFFKLAIAPGNDIFYMGEGRAVAQLGDLSRYWLIARALLRELWNYAGWPVSLVVLLAIYVTILRLDIPVGDRAGIRAVAGIVLLQILGYCGIYVLTPHDLAWHLNFSFARLIFHVYPAAIFLYFCCVNEPEKFFGRSVPAEAVD